MARKKLLIISTGGTIAQSIDKETLATTNKGGKDSDFEQVLSQTVLDELGLEPIKSVGVIDKDSSNVNPDDWKLMAKTVQENYDDYDAFLITHGTNTLGYTCAALSFSLENIGKPVVLTGSQVPFGEPGSDATVNLQNAIRVAADKQPLAGVMAVFGSQIITGARVKKTTEFDYDGFKSFNSPAPIGRVGRVVKINKDALDEHLRYYEPKARNARELSVSADFDMRIASITEFPGMTSDYIISLVENDHVKGIIFRAAGAGDPNITDNNPHAIYDLKRGFECAKSMRIPIVVTTQASDGVSSMDINDPGRIAKDLGAIPAWDMSIEAMTVKLGWLLGNKYKYEELYRQMTKSVKGEVNTSRI